ncbi:hypothetical protein [Bacteroides congonensis]|uniref:hypothetical protein n=1 Tax=Bacteroides congonensis TaxID=1871006 RepID=UPI003A8B5251
MSDRINEILDNYDAKKKAREEEDRRIREEKRNKAAAFNTSVDKLWESVIIPTIDEIKLSLRKRGYRAEDPVRRNIESSGYTINIGVEIASVSIKSNANMQKVTIKVTYHTGKLGENNNEYNLADITSDLITDIFASVLEKLTEI